VLLIRIIWYNNSRGLIAICIIKDAVANNIYAVKSGEENAMILFGIDFEVVSEFELKEKKAPEGLQRIVVKFERDISTGIRQWRQCYWSKRIRGERQWLFAELLNSKAPI